MEINIHMHEVQSKSILSPKNGMNIYRGCSHGCIYCDTRSTCYQFDHVFEDIEVKRNAPELLEKALSSKRKKCMIGTGSMCDPYIPLESQLELTKQCLTIIEKYGFGVSLLTKSARVLRDLELLERINDKTKAVVQMTLTTYDEELCKLIEPCVSTTKERFEALKIFRDHGIPTVVWFGPILPFINDTRENIEGILDYCVEAKVKAIMCFGMGVTLRDGSREYFYDCLNKHFPGMAQRYCKAFGNAYEIASPNNRELMKIYTDTCKKYGMIYQPEKVFEYLDQFEEKHKPIQMSITDFLR
jgi:DNA repair photolyase